MEIKPGKILIIPNHDRKFGSAKTYVLIYTTENNPLMFTEQEIERANERALANIEDLQDYPIVDNKVYKRLLIAVFLFAFMVACGLILFNFVWTH